MRRKLLFLLFLASLAGVLRAQKPGLSFCGASYKDMKKMKKLLDPQFDFLRVADGDTIVDIGSQSGWFNGAFSAASERKYLTFLLLDIDTSCLNTRMVQNMIAHYSTLKGAPITHRFQLVNNRTDSLMLPPEQFGKVWFFNTLHEIPDKEDIVRQIAFITRSGGEVIVLEFVPQQEGVLHGGCNKPLLSVQAVVKLFEAGGFRFAEKKEVPPKNKKRVMTMYRFIKA